MDGVAGTVVALSRYPVKSFAGEDVDEVEVTDAGLAGDRVRVLIDQATGKVVSAKHPRQWPDVLECRATFVEPPRAGQQPPPVTITLADGTVVRSDARDVDAVLSAFFKRDVTLKSAAPEDFRIDQYHPDLPDLDPEGHRDTLVDAKLGSAFFAQAGLPSAVPAGSGFDLFPVSVLTTSTLDQLGALRPDTRFDRRRFRMNIVVETTEPGFVENSWPGHELHIGDDVRLVVMIPDPRCVMTTLPQGDLPKDNGVLRTLTTHNRLDVAGSGRYPCAGVYAVVTASGTVRRGDGVVVA
jgi:uncharacterized protein YcbX